MKFLICTDVAARGIDVSGLPYGNVKYLDAYSPNIINPFPNDKF